jgi:hypothetical protein
MSDASAVGSGLLIVACNPSPFCRPGRKIASPSRLSLLPGCRRLGKAHAEHPAVFGRASARHRRIRGWPRLIPETNFRVPRCQENRDANMQLIFDFIWNQSRSRFLAAIGTREAEQ